jgi:predicted RNA polymerase sigma factor
MDISTIINCSYCTKLKHVYGDDVYQDAIIKSIEYINKGGLIENHKSFFFITCRNINLNNLTKKHITNPIPNELKSIQSLCLDDYLNKNDDLFANVLRMYLICPSLPKLSKKLGISLKTITKIFNDAKHRVVHECDNVTDN